MNKKSIDQKCVYCLKQSNNISNDYIPPKGITPHEFRKDLLTVPVCSGCKSNLTLEDEYFRIAILINDSISEQKNLFAIREKNMGRFIHPTPFSGKFLFNIQKVELYTKDNKYLGSKLQYEIDQNRIENFFIRIVRALYYNETQNFIPVEYYVTSVNLLNKQSGNILFLLYEAIKDITFNNRTEIIKFRYRVYPENHKLHSIWHIIIYDNMNFLVYFSKNDVKSNFQTNVYDYIVKGI